MTYTELKKTMEDDLASGAFRTMSSYSVSDSGGSRTISYRGFDEWQTIYAFVSEKAALEQGTRPYIGRMRAGSR